MEHLLLSMRSLVINCTIPAECLDKEAYTVGLEAQIRAHSLARCILIVCKSKFTIGFL
jgi:hypothetical protein